MSVRPSEILDIRHELPPRLRAKAESVLKTGESPVGVVRARFGPATELFAGADPAQRDAAYQSSRRMTRTSIVIPTERFMTASKEWHLSPELTLQAKEKGGASSLELVDGRGLVTHWRYTPAMNKAAHHFVDRWKLLRNGPIRGKRSRRSDRAALPELRLAHQRGAGLLRELRSRCREPGRQRSLLRLLTFARKRAWVGVIGRYFDDRQHGGQHDTALSDEAHARQSTGSLPKRSVGGFLSHSLAAGRARRGIRPVLAVDVGPEPTSSPG